MRRLLVTLLLAHVVGSYAMIVGLMTQAGPPPAEAWLLAIVLPPRLFWDLITRATESGMPPEPAEVAAVAYVLGFAGVIAWRVREQRRMRRARRRRQGLCTECGYDLTGNVSGKCPECGTHVSARARLLVRRNA